jgi:hypothetical protein
MQVVQQLQTYYKASQKNCEKLDLADTRDGKVGHGVVRRVRIISQPVLPQEFNACVLVELRNSAFHGRGLFAKQSIRKGQLITMYPAHVVLYARPGHKKVMSFPAAELEEKLGSEWSQKFRNFQEYLFQLDREWQILGHPSLDSDPSFLGHFINDGACITSLDGITEDQALRCYVGGQVNYYTKLSRKRQNVKYANFGNLAVGIVALRDIRPDEELLALYSVQYWVQLLAAKAKAEPVLKVLADDKP